MTQDPAARDRAGDPSGADADGAVARTPEVCDPARTPGRDAGPANEGDTRAQDPAARDRTGAPSGVDADGAVARTPEVPDPSPATGRAAGPDGEDATQAPKRAALKTWGAGVAAVIIGGVATALFTGWFQEDAPDLVDRAAGKPPIEVVHVVTYVDGGPFTLRNAVTTQQDRAMLMEPAASEQWQAFLQRRRAEPVDTMNVIAVLEGSRSKARVIDMRPRILRKQARLSGAYFVPATAGEVGTISLAADLDRRNPAFVMDKGKTKEESRAYFRAHQIDLVRGEQTTLAMSFTARTAAYEFDVLVNVIADGKSKEIVIRSSGDKPFRITGRQDRPRGYAQVFNEFEGAWVQAPLGRWCVPSPINQDC